MTVMVTGGEGAHGRKDEQREGRRKGARGGARTYSGLRAHGGRRRDGARTTRWER